jgi:hypothetical protein
MQLASRAWAVPAAREVCKNKQDQQDLNRRHGPAQHRGPAGRAHSRPRPAGPVSGSPLSPLSLQQEGGGPRCAQLRRACQGIAVFWMVMSALPSPLSVLTGCHIARGMKRPCAGCGVAWQCCCTCPLREQIVKLAVKGSQGTGRFAGALACVSYQDCSLHPAAQQQYAHERPLRALHAIPQAVRLSVKRKSHEHHKYAADACQLVPCTSFTCPDCGGMQVRLPGRGVRVRL